MKKIKLHGNYNKDCVAWVIPTMLVDGRNIISIRAYKSAIRRAGLATGDYLRSSTPVIVLGVSDQPIAIIE